MRAPLRICRARGVAVVLALGAAISLTVLIGGLVPALAQPICTTAIEGGYGCEPEPPVTPAPEPPVTPAPEPPVTPATEPPVTPATEPPVTPATEPPVTPATEPPVTPATEPPVTPATEPPVTPATEPPETPTTAGSALQSTASSAGTSQTSTAGSASTSPTSVSGTSGPRTATATSDGVSPTPTTAVQTGQTTIPTETPETLEAAPQDLEAAKASIPVEEQPDATPPSEIDRIRNLLINPATPSANAINGGTWDRTPLQWQPDWVRYDQYHRPVIVDPFRDPLRIVYDVGGAPRILTIPAFSSIVTQVAQSGCELHGDSGRHSWPTRLRGGRQLPPQWR